MRVRINVYGEELGEVEVTRESDIRHLADPGKDLLAKVLDEAVAQVRAAYGITPTTTADPDAVAAAVRKQGRQPV